MPPRRVALKLNGKDATTASSQEEKSPKLKRGRPKGKKQQSTTQRKNASSPQNKSGTVTKDGEPTVEEEEASVEIPVTPTWRGSDGTYKRPRGQKPKGKVWDSSFGIWTHSSSQKNQPKQKDDATSKPSVTSKAASKRPSNKRRRQEAHEEDDDPETKESPTKKNTETHKKTKKKAKSDSSNNNVVKHKSLRDGLQLRKVPFHILMIDPTTTQSAEATNPKFSEKGFRAKQKASMTRFTPISAQMKKANTPETKSKDSETIGAKASVTRFSPISRQMKKANTPETKSKDSETIGAKASVTRFTPISTQMKKANTPETKSKDSETIGAKASVTRFMPISAQMKKANTPETKSKDSETIGAKASMTRFTPISEQMKMANTPEKKSKDSETIGARDKGCGDSLDGGPSTISTVVQQKEQHQQRQSQHPKSLLLGDNRIAQRAAIGSDDQAPISKASTDESPPKFSEEEKIKKDVNNTAVGQVVITDQKESICLRPSTTETIVGEQSSSSQKNLLVGRISTLLSHDKPNEGKDNSPLLEEDKDHEHKCKSVTKSDSMVTRSPRLRHQQAKNLSSKPLEPQGKQEGINEENVTTTIPEPQKDKTIPRTGTIDAKETETPPCNSIDQGSGKTGTRQDTIGIENESTLESNPTVDSEHQTKDVEVVAKNSCSMENNDYNQQLKNQTEHATKKEGVERKQSSAAAASSTGISRKRQRNIVSEKSPSIEDNDYDQQLKSQTTQAAEKGGEEMKHGVEAVVPAVSSTGTTSQSQTRQRKMVWICDPDGNWSTLSKLQTRSQRNSHNDRKSQPKQQAEKGSATIYQNDARRRQPSKGRQQGNFLKQNERPIAGSKLQPPENDEVANDAEMMTAEESQTLQDKRQQIDYGGCPLRILHHETSPMSRLSETEVDNLPDLKELPMLPYDQGQSKLSAGRSEMEEDSTDGEEESVEHSLVRRALADYIKSTSPKAAGDQTTQEDTKKSLLEASWRQHMVGLSTDTVHPVLLEDFGRSPPYHQRNVTSQEIGRNQNTFVSAATKNAAHAGLLGLDELDRKPAAEPYGTKYVDSIATSKYRQRINQNPTVVAAKNASHAEMLGRDELDRKPAAEPYGTKVVDSIATTNYRININHQKPVAVSENSSTAQAARMHAPSNGRYDNVIPPSIAAAIEEALARQQERISCNVRISANEMNTKPAPGLLRDPQNRQGQHYNMTSADEAAMIERRRQHSMKIVEVASSSFDAAANINVGHHNRSAKIDRKASNFSQIIGADNYEKELSSKQQSMRGQAAVYGFTFPNDRNKNEENFDHGSAGQRPVSVRNQCGTRRELVQPNNHIFHQTRKTDNRTIDKNQCGTTNRRDFAQPDYNALNQNRNSSQQSVQVQQMEPRNSSDGRSLYPRYHATVAAIDRQIADLSKVPDLMYSTGANRAIHGRDDLRNLRAQLASEEAQLEELSNLVRLKEILAQKERLQQRLSELETNRNR